MKLLTVVGARPQFIKAAPLSRTLRERGYEEYLLHTGQHYDYGMSGVFFEELGIPEADEDLGVGSGTHGHQTAAMLAGVEDALLREKPDFLLVYGDTNSTLAGALAAVKLNIPVAHVEAGLRSFNRSMPEEHNRVLTDHCSALLFCPTKTAVNNLANEGITDGVVLTGDLMFDSVLANTDRAESLDTLDRFGVHAREYLLATVHRPYNTDDAAVLRTLLEGMMAAGETVVFPVHPRTRARIAALGPDFAERMARSDLRVVEPVSYLSMLQLQKNARIILTDSGGVQKEAYFLGVPCITLRPETEWVETLEGGWNRLVGDDRSRLGGLIAETRCPDAPRMAFGEGHAAASIIGALEAFYANP